MDETIGEEVGAEITLRCPFCLTRNRVDVGRAAHRPRCGSCSKPLLLDRPVKVAEEDFEATVLEASVPVLVDFFAEWCGPCKILAPMLDEIAGANAGKLVVAKVDTDRAQRVAGDYEIRGVPTVVLFKNGREIDRSVGIEPERLRAMVDAA